jgi:hypothetical protein
MARVLISAFNPDLGRLPAHSAFVGQVSPALKGKRRETYSCGLDGSEAIARSYRRLLQHHARVLRIEDLLIHLLAEPAKLDRDDGKWILARDHADSVGALHPLAVRHLVVFLRS